jgi:hypothetical protein
VPEFLDGVVELVEVDTLVALVSSLNRKDSELVLLKLNAGLMQNVLQMLQRDMV